MNLTWAYGASWPLCYVIMSSCISLRDTIHLWASLLSGILGPVCP